MCKEKKIDWCIDWFNTAYYHILYAKRNNIEAEKFIATIVESLPIKPGSNVLDIACGSGRHCEILHNYQLNVWGIDIAENNINKAKNNLSAKIIFEVFDMRNVYKSSFFDYVLNLFTSFGYFENDNENFASIKAMSANLKSGGTFILDYLNSFFIENNLVSEEKISVNDIKFHIKRKIINQRVVKTISVNDKGNLCTYEENVRLYSLEEMTEMIHKAGMELISIYGDYSLGKFNKTTSSRLIIVAKKI